MKVLIVKYVFLWLVLFKCLLIWLSLALTYNLSLLLVITYFAGQCKFSMFCYRVETSKYCNCLIGRFGQ